jgi:RNase P/RNase MRP subunit POP5
MGVEADILLIVNRFALILAERQNNVNVALSLLKREGTLKNYNLEILKRLEQIINDEKILSQIK